MQPSHRRNTSSIVEINVGKRTLLKVKMVRIRGRNYQKGNHAPYDAEEKIAIDDKKPFNKDEGWGQ